VNDVAIAVHPSVTIEAIIFSPNLFLDIAGVIGPLKIHAFEARQRRQPALFVASYRDRDHPPIFAGPRVFHPLPFNLARDEHVQQAPNADSHYHQS
jgi:hypothetical protein